MARSSKKRKRSELQGPAPKNGGNRNEPPRSSRAEVLQQAEALVVHALTSAMRIGYGNELFWPGSVARDDGYQVRIAEAAIELASDRLAAVQHQLAREIAEILGIADQPPRPRYRVVPRVSRNEPEPPSWFMPSEAHEPPEPLADRSGVGPAKPPRPVAS